MPQKISISQLKDKLRQEQSKRTQVIAKLNQEIRTYNSKVRAYNSRARANRDRFRRELQKLECAMRKPQYAIYRNSVETFYRSYERFELHAKAHVYANRLDRFLNLSEHEAANAVRVISAIHGNEPENGTESDLPNSQIERKLNEISRDFGDQWRGAPIALTPRNPEAARHFCTSARELLTEIFNRFANDKEVVSVIPDCNLTQHGKPTLKAKIQYIFQRHGIVDNAATTFVDDDIEDVVQLFRALNDGTHGSSGRFEHSQLVTIQARVEGLILFLLDVITGQAFAET